MDTTPGVNQEIHGRRVDVGRQHRGERRGRGALGTPLAGDGCEELLASYPQKNPTLADDADEFLSTLASSSSSPFRPLGDESSSSMSSSSTGVGGEECVVPPRGAEPGDYVHYRAKIVCGMQLVYDVSEEASLAYERGEYPLALELFSKGLSRARVVAVAAQSQAVAKVQAEKLGRDASLPVPMDVGALGTQDSEGEPAADLPRLVAEIQLHLVAVHLRLGNVGLADQTCEELLVEVRGSDLLNKFPELVVKLLVRKAQILALQAKFESALALLSRAQELAPTSLAVSNCIEYVNKTRQNAAAQRRSGSGSGRRGKGIALSKSTTTSSSSSSSTTSEEEEEVSFSPTSGQYISLFDEVILEREVSKQAAGKAKSQASTDLMNSGAFGSVCSHFPLSGPEVSPFRMLADRARGAGGVGFCPGAKVALLSSRKLLPTRFEGVVASSPERVYAGRWSADGTMYVTASQDWRVRVYDTSRSSEPSLTHDISAMLGRWTLTDLALSESTRKVFYSSITPVVYAVDLDKPGEAHQEVSFLAESGWGGIWSMALAPDEETLIVGTSTRSVVGSDLETGTLSVSIRSAHGNDVNSVVYPSNNDTNILATGSDDTTIKVWDLRDTRTPVGVLVGHLEGVTCVAAKGDGYYLASNGKDQQLKLWDLRSSLIPVSDFNSLPKTPSSFPSWNYYESDYPGRGMGLTHPADASVLSLSGHKVLQTLIQCGFSPSFTTGSRYLYSGSHDGHVSIYDTQGDVVSVLQPTDRPMAPIRDVAWHPYDARVYTASWSGDVCSYGAAH